MSSEEKEETTPTLRHRSNSMRLAQTPLFYPTDPEVPPSIWQKLKSMIATFLLYYLVVVPVMFLTTKVTNWTNKRYKARQEKRCETILQSTEDARTWIMTSVQLDKLRDYDRWKLELPYEKGHPDPFCDAEGMIQETAFIHALIKTRNYKAMGEYLRTHLHRNAHGCTARGLFRYYSGTKLYAEKYYAAVRRLIEVFVQEREVLPSEFSSSDISTLLDDEGNAIELPETAGTSQSSYTQSILEWAQENPDQGKMTTAAKYSLLQATAQSFGRTALLLSGGASLGMYHIGVVRALWYEGLMPRIISGSSAGAIVASIFCTRSDTEIDEMLTDELKIKNVCFSAFEFIEDVEHNVNVKVRRLMNSGAFMDVNQLVVMLRENCGDMTLLEAYKLTGRVLNISVAADREGEKSMLLNYINSPHVIIWSAVSASCAFPSLFTAVPLVQMDPVKKKIVPFLEGQLWFDGSVAADLPKKQLAELFNCNCFIVSQTNPHVIPFQKGQHMRKVHKGKSSLGKTLWFAGGREVYYWLMKLWRFGVLPKTGRAEVPYLMASQDYEGDITIYPIGSVWNAIPDFVNLTTNPTDEHMLYVMSVGLRRTWPYVHHIRCLTEIERTLETELRRLTQQLIVNGRTEMLRRNQSFSLGESFSLGSAAKKLHASHILRQERGGEDIDATA